MEGMFCKKSNLLQDSIQLWNAVCLIAVEKKPPIKSNNNNTDMNDFDSNSCFHFARNAFYYAINPEWPVKLMRMHPWDPLCII